MEKVPLFWRLQIVGWAVFLAATFPTKLLVCGSVSEVIGAFALRDGISFILTLVMRAIYRRVYRCHKEPAWIVGSILVVSSAAALAQLPPYYWFSEIFPYEEKTIFGQFAAAGIVTFRGGQFLGWSILYFGIKIWLEKQATQKKFQEERNIRQQAELQMLRALINSHFLCNALSSIMETWRLGKPEVGEMLQALSDYLHYSLRHRSDDVVPLSEEIEALKNYLVLQKARLGPGLDFGMQIVEDTRTAKVPGFVLQPLVENAIKYGQESHPRRVTVRVVIIREESRLIIQVLNTGHWIKPDPFRESGGVSLEVIQRKFSWLYPGQSSLTTLEEEGWVTVEIKIPYIP
jgi:two-component system LytT family sensor kinase